MDGAPVHIGQAGAVAPAQCRYSISPAVRSFDYFGGTGTFSVITQPGCSWKSPAFGELRFGSREQPYSIAFNDTISIRSQQIEIENATGDTVAVFTALVGPIHSLLPQMLPAIITALGDYIFRFVDGEGAEDLEEMRMRLVTGADGYPCEFVYRRSTNLLSAGDGSTPLPPGARADYQRAMYGGCCRLERERLA